MRKVMDIPREQLRHIQDAYCCAGCWNAVIVSFDNTLTGDQCFVDCGTDECSLPGFVSAHYVERRLAVDSSEALEARIVLGKSAECGWLARGRVSVAETLAELGF